MAPLGYRSAEVDAMEIWEVASVLGVDEPAVTPEEDGNDVGPRPAMADASPPLSRAVERMLAHTGQGPEVEPAPTKPSTLAAFLSGRIGDA